MSLQGLSPSPREQYEWPDAARRRGFLSHLREALVYALIEGAQRVDYPAGSVLLQWEDNPSPAVVLRGSIRIFLSAPSGAQLTLRYLQVGDLFGWTNLHLTRGVEALVDSELLLLNLSLQRRLASSEAAVADALREDTRRGLNDLLRLACVRAFGSIRMRVASGLVEHARVSGAVGKGRDIAITQEDLANAIGSVREVVAHALQALKRDGVIAIRRGGVTILDPNRLMREADGGLGLSLGD